MVLVSMIRKGRPAGQDGTIANTTGGGEGKRRGKHQCKEPKNDLKLRPPQTTRTVILIPCVCGELQPNESFHTPCILFPPLVTLQECSIILVLAKSTEGGNGRVRTGAFPLPYNILLKIKV